MNIESASILVCRASGLVLLVIGLCFMLPTFFFGVDSGWTSYAPVPRPEPRVRIQRFFRGHLPHLGIVAMGVALILASHPIGRLLAAGLRP